MLKPVITQNKKLQDYYDKAMVELNKFFHKNWVYGTPKFFVVADRKTMDELRGKETEDWVVGFGLGRYAIVVLDPDKFETESSHKYTDGDIRKLIKHELCHCFYSLLTGEQHPWWLGEGLSLFVADQINNYRQPKTFCGFLDGKNVYQEGVYAVKLLVEHFGTEKLLEFIKALGHTNDEKAVFRKIYGEALSYDFFNSLLE